MTCSIKKDKKVDLDFDIQFFEGIERRSPDYPEVLEILGALYTQAGRIDDGLRIDKRLVTLSPENPTANYNLACSLALSGRIADALRTLRKAIDLGYNDANWMLKDADLKSLHSHPAFQRMVEELRNA